MRRKGREADRQRRCAEKDRQTDRQTDRQAGIQTDWLTHKQKVRKIEHIPCWMIRH